ncbi:LysR family transcriptional regulator [Christensenella tenuis]|jgi:LysR family transcriptional regulator, transcriptional activator of the cysJI operon|uniref:LysR family transcriptional regulator n=1 Tax=Christensenella tenuis TaxID=2763033 RepID=A0ABR7EFS1_9FIRM|nr:LysR family transcriptional regulator [Christensenella tenuis]MBC5647974.1 LysR family transcriptional regulator [Christensenella tenuis]
MLDFRMDTFLMVCETMNFTRAAERLNITQPAVSQHIRFLEEYYGAKLFAYQGKKLELTEAGRLLQSAGLTMKHDVMALKEEMGGLGSGKLLRFGVTLTVGEFVIPGPAARYLANHPGVSLRMDVSNTKELLRKLDGGEIDFALVEGNFAKNEYEHLVYATEPYIAVCGKGHVFRTEVHKIEDLTGERIIVREAGSGTREILERYLEGRNLMLEDFGNFVEVSNINAIKMLVGENCGITFLYEAAVRRELCEGTLKRIPLEEFALTHDLTFIWRKGSVFSENYRKIFMELQETPGTAV